jgi:hypothetical protein
MLASVPTMAFGFKELGKHIMEVENVVWFVSSSAALICQCVGSNAVR